MIAVRGVSERLRTGDLPQVGLLALTAVAVALVASWPARPGLPHEGWYAVAQTRSVVVALVALGYGSGLFLEAPRRMAATNDSPGMSSISIVTVWRRRCS